jgi:hypothetical protein
VVVVETPGGSERTFGITVIHRRNPDADYSLTNEKIQAGNIRVAVGDNWRPLCMSLLHDLADSIGVKPRHCDIFFMCCSGSKLIDEALTEAVDDHVYKALLQ